MSATPNVITPRQLAVSLIQHEAEDVRQRISDHVDHRNADDVFNSQVRVFLERTLEMLKDAAQHLQDHAGDDV